TPTLTVSPSSAVGCGFWMAMGGYGPARSRGGVDAEDVPRGDGEHDRGPAAVDRDRGLTGGVDEDHQLAGRNRPEGCAARRGHPVDGEGRPERVESGAGRGELDVAEPVHSEDLCLKPAVAAGHDRFG